MLRFNNKFNYCVTFFSEMAVVISLHIINSKFVNNSVKILAKFV